MNHDRAAARSTALLVESLTKVLGGRRVVDGVSFHVSAGEVVGFLGPNGAGKTTTIRMLLGLAKPTAGRCRVLGESVPGPVLERVGSLVEGPAFYPWMSAASNIKSLSPISSRPEVDRVLKRVDLQNTGRQRAGTFSLGMKQRLALGIALAGNPDVLLLDEPVNGLDPAGIRDFRLLLRDLAASGTAILLSSHQMGEVEMSCDRVVVLDHGRVVAEGPPGQLGGGATQIEIRLDVSVPQSRDMAIQALQHLSCEELNETTLLVHSESGAEVNRLLAEAGVFPESISARSETLEDRFFNLTRRGVQ